MEAGGSSMACYQNAAAIHIVIKHEAPLRLPPSPPPSALLYLCLFSCIPVFLLDPISIIEIISALPNLSLETILCSPFLFFSRSSILSIPRWLHHHNLVSCPICCFFLPVFSSLCLCLCCFTTKICDSMATALICFSLWCSCLCLLLFEWSGDSSRKKDCDIFQRVRVVCARLCMTSH